MTEFDTTVPPPPAASSASGAAPAWTRLHGLVLMLGLLFLAWQAWLFQHKLDAAVPPLLTDFNDFHVVGTMVAHGQEAAAYDWPALKAEQIAQTGNWAFLPWAYPPQFTLLTAVLGIVPLWAAYMLFVGGSWLLFYTALRRLAPGTIVPALLLALPAILINGKCGQTGFLSAGLMGWFLVWMRERRAGAGWPLGAMIFKPHLAAGIGLLTLMERRWAAIVRAGVLVLALTVAAHLAFGPSIWTAFRGGTDIAGRYLWAGEYPLERMTSVFAALHRFGLPPAWAMAIHLALTLAAVTLFLLAWRRNVDRDLVLAAAIGVSLTASPYTYDYDNVAMGLIAGLLLPRFVARASLVEALSALVLSWIATSNYLWIGLRQIYYGVPMITAEMRLWTISPIALAALAALVIVVLRRPSRAPATWTRLYIRAGGNLPA